MSPPLLGYCSFLRSKRWCRHIRRETGLEAHCLTYKVRRKSLAQAALQVADQVRGVAPEGQPVFAIACSLGTVVLRHVMALPQQGAIKWSGCVLIAPPSQGRCSASLSEL